MTEMRNHNLRQLTRGLLGAVLLQMAIAPSASPQTARRSYTVNPSSVGQGNVYHLTIKSVVCTSSDLLRTDLTAPPGSGITVEAAVGASGCTMVARIAVDGDAPAGPVVLQITKDDSPWGTVDLQVTGSVVREPSADPAPGSAKPQPNRLEALLAPAAKPKGSETTHRRGEPATCFEVGVSARLSNSHLISSSLRGLVGRQI